ncbi:hypothetical protein [Mesorhizobium sp. KR1-2]|uniref:hypothetical protein n=1 Tax=Mesorhizobium sp. KR1-2 TaxID=3156609 RepID=UPI0032B32112
MFGISKSKAPTHQANHEMTEMDIPGFEEELGEALALAAAETPPGPLDPSQDIGTGDESSKPTNKQSSGTQASLAALVAFENEMRDAAAGLEVLESTMAAIGAAHETANRLLGNLRTAVLRANGIEDANMALSAEKRHLSEQLEQAKHLQRQQESASEADKRRIELLIKDFDEVKIALGRTQVETIDLRAALADAEAEKSSLIYELATKASTADRLMRETELLRQKCVNHQISHAGLEQRSSELALKLDELSSIRKAETVEMEDLRVRYEHAEKESRRLQKQSELSQVRQAETQERIMTLEADLEEMMDRCGAMSERFRAESEVMRAKLDTAVRKNVADADEIAALKQRLGEALATASVAEAQRAGSGARTDVQTSKPQTPSTPPEFGGSSYSRVRSIKNGKILATGSHVNGGGEKLIRPPQQHG